ncbi:MAG TPA: glycosyltransferase family 9 protein [Longimicrobiaceae bacterium]
MSRSGSDSLAIAELAGKRICLVLLTGLGDVVMGLPVANALKRHVPGVHVTWVAEPMPAGVLRGHPAVDRIVVYEKKKGVRGLLGLREALKGGEFDLTLNLNYYFKSIWPVLLSRAPRRIGFDRGRSRDGTWLAVNEHLAPRPRSHTVDMFLEFLDHLGVPRNPIEWRLELTSEERRAQASFFERFNGDPVAALVPASANSRKDWFPDRFARVAEGLREDFGYHVLLVGGPGERETNIAQEIESTARTEVVWALGDGVRRLVWLLAGSDLVIAPDTGPVHIARALDVPVIGLYGHTNPWRVGPYRRFEDLWIDEYTDPGEAPDPSRFDPKQERMERIRPEDVLERVERARERYPRTVKR